MLFQINYKWIYLSVDVLRGSSEGLLGVFWEFSVGCSGSVPRVVRGSSDTQISKFKIDSRNDW